MTRKNIQIAYYEKTDEQKKRMLYYRKSKILKGDNNLLKKMVQIVESNVKKYKSDFYIHDVELMKEYAGDPYIWIVREYGTHCIYLLSTDFTKDNQWENKPYFKAILNNFSDIKGIYLIKNGELKKITKEKTFSILERYEKLIRDDLKKYAYLNYS